MPRTPASSAARSRTSATTGTTARPASRTNCAGLREIGWGAQGVGDGVDIGADVDRDDVGALFGQRDGRPTERLAGWAPLFGYWLSAIDHAERA